MSVQPKQVLRVLSAAVCGIALLGCGPKAEDTTAPAATATTQAQVLPDIPRPELDARRHTDLIALNNAIQAFHTATGKYPITEGNGFANVMTPNVGANWIPGLAPTYIASLPREPLGSNDPQGPQYTYASDGEGYKLIVHGVPGSCDAAVERDGIRRDPARTRDGGCWAYGFWTNDKRNF